MVDQEGTFSIRHKTGTIPGQVGTTQLQFFFIQNTNNGSMAVKQLHALLDCGIVFEDEGSQMAVLKVDKHRDIVDKVIPFFAQHREHLRLKKDQFSDFVKAAELMESRTADHQESSKIIRRLCDMDRVGLRAAHS